MINTWNEDKEKGDKGELLFAEYLKKIKGDKVLIYHNDDASFDIKLIEDFCLITLFEVKTDYKTTNPDGNLFIEFETRLGNPSGISLSEADWYIYIFAHFNELWIIKKDDLLKILYGMGYTFPVGESSGNKNKGYLIPRNSVDEIKKLFTIKLLNTSTLL